VEEDLLTSSGSREKGGGGEGKKEKEEVKERRVGWGGKESEKSRLSFIITHARRNWGTRREKTVFLVIEGKGHLLRGR